MIRRITGERQMGKRKELGRGKWEEKEAVERPPLGKGKAQVRHRWGRKIKERDKWRRERSRKQAVGKWKEVEEKQLEKGKEQERSS